MITVILVIWQLTRKTTLRSKKQICFQTAMSTLRTAATESKAPAPALSSHSMVKSDGIGDIAFAGAANAKSGIMDKLTEAIKSPLFSL